MNINVFNINKIAFDDQDDLDIKGESNENEDTDSSLMKKIPMVMKRPMMAFC